MNKRILFILLGVLAFFIVLAAGAVGGAALAYFLLEGRPARAALTFRPVEVHTETGVLVASVEPDSTAARAGLARGDIITEVNGEAINSPLELIEALQASEQETAELTVLHGDDQRSLSLDLNEARDPADLGMQLVEGSFSGRVRMFGPHFGFQLDGHPGALVTQVRPDSPAEAGGLQTGDLITAVDGEAIGPESNLAEVIGSHTPGDQITLTIRRANEAEDLEVEVTLGESPDQAGQAYLGVMYMQVPGVEGERPFLPFWMPGPEGETLPEQFPFFGEPPFDRLLPDLPEGVESAVIVGQVTPDGPAETAGLQTGDLITELDGQPVESREWFVDSIQAHQPGDELTLTVVPSGDEEPLSIQVRLGEHPETDGAGYLGASILGHIRIERERSPSPDLFFRLRPEDEFRSFLQEV